MKRLSAAILAAALSFSVLLPLNVGARRPNPYDEEPPEYSDKYSIPIQITVETPCEEHDFDDWVVTTEPTCTVSGIRMQCCKNCSVKLTQILPALGHYGNWIVDKPATCTEDGIHHRICERCKIEETEAVAKLGHDFEYGVCTRCRFVDPEYARLGDINNDTKINGTDVNILTKSVSGIYELTQRQLLCADVNADTKVNATDANMIKKYVGGVINKLGK